MATTEETRIALETINNARLIAVNRALDTIELTAIDADVYRGFAVGLHAGMMAVAAYWREESKRLEAAIKKTKGWKGRSEFLLQAAGELAGFAGGLVMPSFLGELTDEGVAATGPQIAGSFGPGQVSTGHLSPVPVGGTVEVGGITFTKVGDNPFGTDADAFVAGVKDYLSGATDTLPIDDSEAVVTITPPAGLTFVDPAGPPPRLTWADFARGVNELPPREHGSHALISSLAECGVKFALDRMGRHNIAGVTPELPAWYMVGGTAFHKATEQIERLYMTGGDPESLVLAKTWGDAFYDQTLATRLESNVDPSQWRAAKKGLEGYDWWRVQGEAMLKSYLRYWDATKRGEWEIFVMPDGRPALELELTLDVNGWPVVCIIDQVRQNRNTGQLRITDLKSGATKQAETFQLGLYAHALGQTLALLQLTDDRDYLSSVPAGPHRFDISGGFYDARAGSHDLEVDDLLSAHPWDEIVWRTNAARAQLEAAAYLPRVSIFGGGCTSCGQRSVCPAQRS